MRNILAACMFFTRLPFWRIIQLPKENFKNVVNYWPFAGIITGGSMAGVLYLSAQILPVNIAVILAIATRLLVTGCLHEDGLADFFDGFGGGTSREKTLAIMKDSHIGSYATIGLIVYFILLYSLLSFIYRAELAAAVVFCGDIFAKALSSHIINVLAYARNEQESKNKLVYNRMPFVNIIVNILFVVAIFYLLLPPELYVAIFFPIVVFLALMLLMKKKINGYTGDCCGATFLLCELAFYISVVIICYNVF